MLKLLLISTCIAFPFIVLSQEQLEEDKTTIPFDDTLVQNATELISDDVPTISFDELESQGISSNISSILTAGRDVYLNAVAFNFGIVRFKPRGYDGDFSSSFINGIPMDNIDNGYTPYSVWGGLNDVMRNRETAIGLKNNNFSFGDPLVSTNIDIRASKQRKQLLIGYAISNRSYRQRYTATYSSGQNRKGWSYTVSGSLRWSDEGYVPGTYYHGKSYFIAVDKRFSQRSLLSLIVFGAPTENGRQSGSIEEMKILADDNYYNPSWGFQNGIKRSANIGYSHQPVLITSWEWKINPATTLLTSASILNGKKSTTGIDWYNAPDPRPDYYRTLPSYIADPDQKEQVAALMMNNEAERQINWDKLYQINYENFATIENVNGITGNSISGKRSLYVLQDRVTNQQKYTLTSNINSRISDHAYFSGGALFIKQKNENYQQLKDLLGGDFYVNLNQFAERDFPNNPSAYQYDIETPNRIIKVGDKFGYNYDIDFQKAAAWWQLAFNFRHIDFFIATEFSSLKYRRIGNNRNGLFPENSKGISPYLSFQSISVKGGLTYKFDGRNYLYFNAASFTRPPLYENVYVSVRTRNNLQENIKQENILIGEGGYILNAPSVKLKASGYYSLTNDKMKVFTFYHESYRSFVNYVVRNIDKLSYGAELAAEVKLLPTLSSTFIAGIARYFYNSRQNAMITIDNTSEVVEQQEIFSKNYHYGTTPEMVCNTTLSYRSPKYWFLNLTGNYLGKSWLDINPIRRTTAATNGIDPKSVEWQSIVGQTNFSPVFTLDFFGGYSHYFKSQKNKKPFYITFLAGINNVLNNRNIISGGYEQLRFDFDTKNVDQFPPKLFYAPGLNYFISISYRQ